MSFGASARDKDIAAGDDLIVEGSDSDALYVVLDGSFDVTRLITGSPATTWES